MTPVAGLAAGADALAAVGGGAHPALEREVGAQRRRRAVARGRAGPTVIGAASTITPGLNRPSGSNSALTSRNAA